MKASKAWIRSHFHKDLAQLTDEELDALEALEAVMESGGENVHNGSPLLELEAGVRYGAGAELDKKYE